MEWDTLFVVTILTLVNSKTKLDGKTVTVKDGVVFVGSDKLHSSIIDDILIWSSNVPAILIYSECMCRFFQQYRVSFRLDKCYFLQEVLEFVGRDLTADSNYSAASKFDMINDWELPVTCSGLHSFVGLVIFYHRYAPYLEMRIKPLRRLLKLYFRQDIPLIAWSPSLLQLFQDIKTCITSSPVLARYDHDKPVFLKTDWSAEGMGVYFDATSRRRYLEESI